MSVQPSPPDRAAAGLLRVDRIACTGHGICASILPHTVRLDEWGYPVIDPSSGADEPSAYAAAVRLCPALALALSSPS